MGTVVLRIRGTFLDIANSLSSLPSAAQQRIVDLIEQVEVTRANLDTFITNLNSYKAANPAITVEAEYREVS